MNSEPEKGLIQIAPSTMDELLGEDFDPFDPIANAKAAAKIMGRPVEHREHGPNGSLTVSIEYPPQGENRELPITRTETSYATGRRREFVDTPQGWVLTGFGWSPMFALRYWLPFILLALLLVALAVLTF